MSVPTPHQAMEKHLAKIRDYIDRLETVLDRYDNAIAYDEKITWDQVGDMGYAKEELANLIKFVRA